MGLPVLCPVNVVIVDHPSLGVVMGIAFEANLTRQKFALPLETCWMYSVRECLMGRPVLTYVERHFVYHPIAGVVPGTAKQALNLFMK